MVAVMVTAVAIAAPGRRAVADNAGPKWSPLVVTLTSAVYGM
jgi:hypothetical protein